MSVADDLKAARASMAAELKAEAAYCAANGPKPSYSDASGRSVHWTEWRTAQIAAIKELGELVEVAEVEENAVGDLYEYHTRAWTP